MALKEKVCDHLKEFDPANKKNAESYECAECVKSGDMWVHLRTCQQCGITLCCDSSPNQHASKHAKAHQHPVITSAEPGENWAWCYEHLNFLKF
jgi:uncharacterized UBP type Zn finger protein